MKKRKLMSMLAVLLTISCIAGCGSTSKQEASKESASTSKETGSTTAESKEEATTEAASSYQTTYGSKQFDNVTIKVELFDRSNAPDGSTLTDNRWVNYVNEEMGKVGINVEFVGVPRSDEITKMQSMMASGTAPDLVFTYTYAYAGDYYEQGGTWDLSEFVDGDGQAENLKAFLGEEVLNIGRNLDGTLYGITAKRANTALTNLYLRKDWLDALNLSVPTTPDELYDMIDKMTAADLDGTKPIGFEYTSSLTARRNNLFMAFSQLAGDDKQMDISCGYDYYYDPGYREYVRFLNKLYNHGLMDQEYYTVSTETMNSDYVNGKVAFAEQNVNYMTSKVNYLNLMATLQENVPGAEYVSIPALKNVNDGQQYSESYSLGGMILFCPKTADAETVEACMTYLDWLCTKEGGYVLYHGMEGEHYKLNENNVPVVIDSDYNSTDKDWIRNDLCLTFNGGYFENDEQFMECMAAENPEFSEYVIENYKNALSGKVIADTTYESPSAAKLNTDLNMLKNEWSVKCITCSEAEFDAQYDEWMKAAEDAGIQTIIEERTEYYNQLYAE